MKTRTCTNSSRESLLAQQSVVHALEQMNDYCDPRE
jgi:hypothetical protein